MISCCTANREVAYTGSQFRRGFDYVQDPLEGTVQLFMNNSIPAGFGPLNVPYLTAVTALTGVGFNYLSSVPTLTMQTPFAVDIMVANIPERWFLIAGTGSPTAGIVLPNDYDPTSNAKKWIQLT